ncbi:MAG: transposase, partial [Dechloromonas sp.]
TKAFIQGGKRMAEPYAPMFPPSSLLGSPHGQRTWMVTHVDTTVMDVSETHPNQDREISKSHLMKLVDAFSGEELAAHRFEGAPNAMCVRELLLHCYARHRRLPAAIVCDHGKEHKNTWLEKACALLGIILIYRPVSDPRKGSPVETTFSTLCRQLLHNLSGNTALLKQARLVTKAVDPRAFTLWSREEIDALLEEYLTLRNNLPRQRKPSPLAISRATDLKFGPAPLPNLSERQVREALMPLVPRFMRKVSKRGTIYCNKHTYHSTELEEFIGEYVEVRSEPLAKGIAPEIVYAHPKGSRRTIECTRNDISGPSADLVAAAKVIDEQTLGPSPYPDVTSAEIAKAKFEAKIVSTEKRMRAKKAERPPPPKVQPPQAIKPSRQFTFTPVSTK